jgi:hypothetical protein
VPQESANCRLELGYAHQQGVDCIPLMVQKEYSPQGWLGLLMGTRLWYSFAGADHDDDAAFEKRVGDVAKEIGLRAMATAQVQEGVPPPPHAGSTATAASSLAPATVQAGTAHSQPPSAAPTPLPPVAVTGGGAGPGSSMVAQQQQQHLEGQLRCLRDEVTARMDELVASQQAAAAAAAASAEFVAPTQLAALQSRVEGLVAQELLTQDEAYELQDLVADHYELRTLTQMTLTQAVVCSGAYPLAAKIATLVGLSEGIATDASFARQARRKVLSR